MTAAAAAPVDPAHVDVASTAAQLAAAQGAEKAAAAATPPDPGTPEKPAEPKTEPAKPAEPKESAGAVFARLARAERARVEKEQKARAEIDAERAKVQAEKAEVERLRKEAQEIREAEARAKADPAGYLERMLGKDWYERLTEIRLSGGKVPADLTVRAVEEKLESRIEALKREQEEARKRDTEERQKALDAEKARIAAEQKAVIEQFHADTVEFVKQRAEEYELTNLYDSQDLVVEVIEQHFAETKRVLSAKEAADLVEKHLEEQVEKASKAKKLASRFAPPPKKEDPPKPAPTLSNGTATAPVFAGPAKTEEERIARAIAAMEAARAK